MYYLDEYSQSHQNGKGRMSNVQPSKTLPRAAGGSTATVFLPGVDETQKAEQSMWPMM